MRRTARGGIVAAGALLPGLDAALHESVADMPLDSVRFAVYIALRSYALPRSNYGEP